jgi:hypothetical protein
VLDTIRTRKQQQKISHMASSPNGMLSLSHISTSLNADESLEYAMRFRTIDSILSTNQPTKRRTRRIRVTKHQSVLSDIPWYLSMEFTR